MTTDKVSGPHARSLSIATQESDATADEGSPERSSDGARSSQTVLLVHDGVESAGGCRHRRCSSGNQEGCARSKGFVWVQLVNPDEDLVTQARETLGIHPVAAADVVSGRQQPKVQKFDEHLFVLLWQIIVERESKRHRARSDLPLHRRRMAADRSARRRGRTHRPDGAGEGVAHGTAGQPDGGGVRDHGRDRGRLREGGRGRRDGSRGTRGAGLHRIHDRGPQAHLPSPQGHRSHRPRRVEHRRRPPGEHRPPRCDDGRPRACGALSARPAR